MQIFRSKLSILAFALFAALFTFASCRKDAEEIVALLTDSEAAEIAESAVSERTAGATMPTIDMTEILAAIPQTCDVPGDTSLQRTGGVAGTSYNYSFTLGWLVDCNDFNIPQSASVDVTGAGTFSSAHWSGNDQCTGDLAITGVAPSATDYVVNGSFALTGSMTGSLRHNDPTLTVNTTVNLSNMTVRKSDYVITGGNGTLVITASNAQGNTQTVNGTLVFNGDGTVTVTINGHSHNFPI